VLANQAACSPWLAVVVGLASCTQVSDRERFEAETNQIRILQTVPTAGAQDADPDQTVEVCLSGLVDPRSLTPSDTAMASGLAVYDTELVLQLVAWSGPGGTPVDPEATGPWCEGSVLSVTPESRLTPGAQYRLRLRNSPTGWAGEPLDAERPGWVVPEEGDEPRFFLEFTVDPNAEPVDEGHGVRPGSDDDDDDTPTLEDLFASGGPFDPERAQCSCHRDPEHLAWRRLDLTDATAAYEGLVGAAGARDGGFAMVAPRDPSQSFLLHKLLRADGEPLHGIVGEAMPPEGPLPYQDLVAVARWIDGGAVP